jgi:hypothetical protein
MRVIAMLETTSFFEEQIKQCTDFAARSTNRNEREFWLKMVQRWRGLLKTRRLDGAAIKTGHRFWFQRLRFAKRRAA